MADRIEIYEVDETWVQVTGDRSLVKELGEYFTYDVPNARFMPAFQNRLWDGKIRLLDYQTQRIYRGLIPYIKQFCGERDYDIFIENTLVPIERTDKYIENFVKSLKLTLDPYDFQMDAIKECIKENRLTLLSPTSSGKSLIIYVLIRYFLEHTFPDQKILLTVPTIGLIKQLMKEFTDYCPSFNIDKITHQIYEGQEKQTDKRFILSTWQSVYKQGRQYFSQFGTILIDEAHQAQADSLKAILEKSINAKFRIGLTGTLDDLEYHRLIIEGLCGPVHRVTSTKTLMDRKIVSELKVKCLILKYDDEIRKQNNKFLYPEEMAFVTGHLPRAKFVANLVGAIPADKNVLVLTAFLKHIEILKKEFEKLGKKVYVVHGNTPADEREDIRLRAEKETGIIILATYGVYSTGINIKNLQYIVMATGSKSQIRLLQSIGRGLRLDGKSNRIIVFDIVDDFGYKGKRNLMVVHFFERVKIYTKEQFSYETKNINI